MNDLTSTRRGFLKLAVAAGLVHYAEPFLQLAPVYHDWVEDRGDFFIVRVPDFKTFSNETLTKPTIFLLGTQAKLANLDMRNFANIHAPRGGMMVSSSFDVSKVRTERPRHAIELKAKDFALHGTSMFGSGLCVHMENK